GVHLPELANDAIRITHGEDLQAKRAWARAEVVGLTFSPGTIFSIGPFALSLPTATFEAAMRVEAGPGGVASNEASASIVGDWQLALGGAPLVTLASTRLTFEPGGHVRFDLDPRNVRLNGALQ